MIEPKTPLNSSVDETAWQMKNIRTRTMSHSLIFSQLYGQLPSHWHLMALLDASRDPSYLALVEAVRGDHACLYHEQMAESLKTVAPYLIEINSFNDSADQLINALFNRSHGVMIASPEDLGAIRHHLRHFLTLKAPHQEPGYWRFYDPHFLDIFLSHADIPSRHLFFGPIQWIGYNKGCGIKEMSLDSHGQLSIKPYITGRFQCPQERHVVTPTRYRMMQLTDRQDQAITDYLDQRDNLMRIERYLKKYYPAFTKPYDPDDLKGILKTALDQARDLGLHSPEDIYLYLSLSITGQTRITQHPKLKHWLSIAAKKNPKQQWYTLFMQLPSSFWAL